MSEMNRNILTGKNVGHTHIGVAELGTIKVPERSPIEQLHRVEAAVLGMRPGLLRTELLDVIATHYREVLYKTAGVTDGDDDG